MSFFNPRQGNDPFILLEGNQTQIDEDFLYCEYCSQVQAHGNQFYSGPGNSSNPPYPLPVSNVAFMFDMVHGNGNKFEHNQITAYPSSPALVGFFRGSDNHDTFTGNIIGYGSVGPISTAFELLTGAVNQIEGIDSIYVTKSLTSNAVSAAGANSLTVLEANGGTSSGWTTYPGVGVDDLDNVQALPAGCQIQTIVGQVYTFQPPCVVQTGQSIAVGDRLRLTAPSVDEKSNWLSVNATSTTGQSILYFEPRFMNPNLAAGMNVYDLTNSTAVPWPCMIAPAGPNFTTGAVPLTCTLTGTVSAGSGTGLSAVTADVIDFDGTLPPSSGITTSAATDFEYSSTPTYLIPNNFNNVFLSSQGSFSKLIKPPIIPRRGQVITLKDTAGTWGQYPLTWLGQTDGASSITLGANYGYLIVQWTGQRWSNLTPIPNAQFTTTALLTAASGTWVPPTNVFAVRVTQCGAAGTGGAVTAAVASASTGQPGIMQSFLSTVVPGNSYSYTVGQAATPPAAGNNNGSNGGNTVFLGVTTKGGAGGSSSASGAASATGLTSLYMSNQLSPMIPTGSNSIAEAPWIGQSLPGAPTTGQKGMNSPWGTGGAAGADANGGAATGYCTPGGAPASTGASAWTSGASTNGAIVVTY